jgi:hypothetical protein
MNREEWIYRCRAKANRFKGERKNANPNPNLEDFIQNPVACIRDAEYAVGAKAAEEAIRFERELWLPRLERWLNQLREDDLGLEENWHGFVCDYLEKEIKRLRRCLGLRKPPLKDEERRAQVRERVRKHREYRREWGEKKSDSLDRMISRALSASVRP